MRPDDEDEHYKPFKMGKLTSDFLFDEGGRQRKIKSHHRRGKGTGLFRKLVAAGLMIGALMVLPTPTANNTLRVYHDGTFDTPPAGQSSIEMPVNDPLFEEQWHLQNTGQDNGTPGMDINIVPAWAEYTGQGCKVSVFELHGAIVEHPEIKGFANLISGDPPPEDADKKYHATNVSNLLAGRANNSFGGVGAAPNAMLASFGGTTIDNFKAQKDYDVVNASWMYVNFFENGQLDDNGKEESWYKALQETIKEGRNGRGTIWMVAAGNDFLRGHNTNYSGFANNRFVNVIGGIDKNGNIYNASSPGANVTAVAPAHDILMAAPTSDIANAASLTRKASGTSFATPLSSGVECLVLEANPNLGYRDARMILALSARQTDKGNATWMFNHASNWNAGRMHVSERFGYGLIDAHAMTRLAETWNQISTIDNEANIGKADATSFDIPDNGSVTRYIDLSDKDDIDLTDAQLRMKIKHPRIGDLLVELVSPSGTVSTLVKTPEQGKFNGYTDSKDKEVKVDEIDYVFGSVQFMGEKANGRWQVRITDTSEGETGSVDLLDLQLYGNEHTNDTRYVFTNEYADLGREFLRQRLDDTDGGRDQVNASPVVTDTYIDLESGVSEIAGRKIELTPHEFEDVVTGDGNDSITGSSRADNTFLPGRGDDTVTANGGENYYYYRDGDGQDSYTPSPDGKDRIFLLRGITPQTTMLTRVGNGLKISFQEKSGHEKPGQIFLGDYFSRGTEHKIAAIQYPDGSFLRMIDSVKAQIGTTPRSVEDLGKAMEEPDPPKRQNLVQRLLKVFS